MLSRTPDLPQLPARPPATFADRLHDLHDLLALGLRGEAAQDYGLGRWIDRVEGAR